MSNNGQDEVHNVSAEGFTDLQSKGVYKATSTDLYANSDRTGEYQPLRAIGKGL